MTEPMITHKRDGAVATLTLDRPGKRNALTRSFWSEMREALTGLERDRQTRAVILTGAGDVAFCAGGDITGFQALGNEDDRRAFQTDAMATFAAIEASPLVVIAAVNGVAFGGGCELALASDIVIAAEHAVFAMPEGRLGLTPGFGAIRAPDVIGRHWASLMILAGERIDAAKAVEIGLAQIIVPGGQLMAHAHELAGRVVVNGYLAQQVGKRLINLGTDRVGFDGSIEALTLLQGSRDAGEGVRAYLERRIPRFTKDVE